MSGPLKKYEVTLPGGRVTTMKLNEADAERYGVGTKAASSKTEQPEPEPETKPVAKSARASNKARTVSDKGDG